MFKNTINIALEHHK